MRRGLVLAALGVGGYLAYRALKPRYDFRNKHVLITGGSRGLGLVLARQLARRGARLSICSRDPAELGRAVEDLREYGGKVVAVECDVTDRARVREFVAVARHGNGPIDVLINNAGVIRVGPVDGMSAQEFEQSMATHFWGPLYAILETAPEMKARGAGRIVNISSFGGKVAVPHLLPYTAGKFALVGLSNGLRTELARHGITVTTVCPGLMRTGSHLNAEFKGRSDEEYAWFALGNATPGLSMSAESAAAKIIDACAIGDAEVVLGLPAKLAVVAQALAPNLMAEVLTLVNQSVLPKPGGGTEVRKGRDSRALVPDALTAHTDRAAGRNNELHASDLPPSLPTNHT